MAKYLGLHALGLLKQASLLRNLRNYFSDMQGIQRASKFLTIFVNSHGDLQRLQFEIPAAYILAD